MGLDTVELLMEFEDEFELRIPDADAEKLGTMGDTVTYLVAALRARWPPTTGHAGSEPRHGPWCLPAR